MLSRGLREISEQRARAEGLSEVEGEAENESGNEVGPSE